MMRAMRIPVVPRYWLLVLLAMLMPTVQAATYTFSGSSFPSCSSGSWSTSGSTHTCNGSISLASGDSIVPATAITVLAKGGITLSGNNTVGSSTATVDLQTTWGSLSSGSGTTIWGDLSANSGTISLSNTTVNGSITTSGTVSLSGGSVSGNVGGSNGVTSTGGTVFGGNVTATSGSISLAGGSVAGSVSSTCCAVTTSYTDVANGISSAHNTVSITGGTISGTISSSGGSGVQIQNATVASGSVVTSNVAINISGSTIGSASNPVNISSNNQITISSSTVYGNVTAGSWPGALTVDSSSTVYGVCTSNTTSTDNPENYGYRCESQPAAATCNTGTISGVVNTYYPGTASVSSGATSIAVGAGSGSSTKLAQGDLILIMQMQDTTIDTSNASSYGSTGAVNAGKYEYATVASVSGSTVTLTGGLANAYTVASYGTTGQKTFQVIRVPVYSSATLGAATAKAWDGGTGGVLAFDVTGTLALNGATADVSGKGFRGGGGCRWGGDDETNNLSPSDYRRTASTSCPADSRNDGRANGLKGEGVAGTPRYVYNGSARVNTGVEGYPNGSTGRGAPANAGGGGTDDNPTANDENTGGGGGGNGGAGGMGGYGWNASSSPGRGIGGAAFASSASRVVMGGGGGAGTSNNGTSDGNGLNSSGVAGGGIIMVRAAAFSGSGSFVADGANNTFAVANDGSGGGGAGGSVLVHAASGLAGLAVSAKGGRGGSNTGGGANHGPGGGGGGGYVLSASSLSSCTVTGGANGTTTTSANAYGATAGSAGICATTLATGQMPGASFGAGPCAAALNHYAIGYPNGNPGVTCEALAVRITGHGSDHSEVAPPAGTQITLSATPAADGWALKSGGGTFTAPDKYAFNGTETSAEFWLAETTPTTSPHIDIDVSDGLRTDLDGDAGEDAKVQFGDAAFKFYACTGAIPATCSAATINHQIAGKSSNAAPNAQSLYLRAVKKDTDSGTCVGGLSGSQQVGFGYECDTPASCTASNLMSINGGTATTVARNGNGTVSATTGSYTDVALTFDANGYAPLSLNYSDAGFVTLHAKKTLTAGSGTPPSTAATIYGASNSFAVRPFALDLGVTDNPKAIAYDGTVFKAAGEAFDATVRGIVWQSTDDADNDGQPDSGSNLADNATAPNFAWATGLAASGSAGSYTPLPANGGVLGTLTPSPANLAQASFSTGSAATSGQTPAYSLTWSEVGSFTLTAATSDYLGVSGFNVTGSTVVGRFIPHHFGVTGTVVTRSDLPTSGTAAPFTYMDEPQKLMLELKAYNLTDGVTKNYTGAFAKLDTSSLGTGANWFNTGCSGTTQCIGLGAVNVATTSTGLSGRLAIHTGIESPSGSWTAGVGSFAAHVVLARANTPDGPFATLKFGALPRDSDGVTVPDASSGDTHKVDLDATAGDTLASNPDSTDERRYLFTTKAYFGRLWLGNAYGSELRGLAVPYETQYWNGHAFVRNADDNLMPFTGANVGLATSLTTPPTATLTNLAAGAGTINLSAPLAQGTVDVYVNLDSTGSPANCANHAVGTPADKTYLSGKWCGTAYDRDPLSRATFGIQAGRRGPIYIRENY